MELSRPPPAVESPRVEAPLVAAAAVPSAPAEEVGAVLSPAGVAVPVLGREGSAWKVSTPCGRDAVLTSVQPIPKHPIVIDPGHGGYDPGAVGPNGLTEARLNLAVSQHARAALERAGFATVLTRDADHGMNLTNRARLATNLQALAFVSVHHNAAAWAPSGVPGSEMYHQVDSADSKRLAGLIYEEVVAALTPYAGPWVTSGAGVTWRTRANGEDWYAMVRQPKGIAAALAELAFISNPPEAALVVRPDVQQAEGEAVARGILRYLRTQDPGSGFTEPYPRPTPPPGPGGGPAVGCVDPPL
ncbi:MAG: N-acetylmuramoyl-L-alanine amidase family protein [Acidimicrobiales bacterium]